MDASELWNVILANMLEDAAPDDPKHFFLQQLHPLGAFGDQFILLTDNEQIGNWVRGNYLGSITQAAKAVTGVDYTVQIAKNPAGAAAQQTTMQVPHPSVATQSNVVPPSPAAAASTGFAAPQQESPIFTMPTFETMPQTNAATNNAPVIPDWMNDAVRFEDLPGQQAKAQQQTAMSAPAPARAMQVGNERLFEKCTFDTFIVGKNNQFARSAALAVAETPGTVYNPLFIYGSSGLGKTHLLVSIANYINSTRPNMAICYTTASDFVEEYVSGVRHGMESFNQRYHHVDVLLIDDVQQLEGKEETINQFFNIFNEMTGQAKQVVLSADRAPKDINMDDRMTSRFASGLCADVMPPDYETRLAIIKNSYRILQQTTAFQSLIPEDVLNWLAEKSSTNIREMEGAVNRLYTNMSLTNKPTISIDEAQEILQDFFPNRGNVKVSIATIQDEVERFFRIEHEDMISSKRSKDIAHARHVAIYLCRYLTDESLESIGTRFGGRDHTTVMHSVKKIEKDQQENRSLFDQLDTLINRIKEQS